MTMVSPPPPSDPNSLSNTAAAEPQIDLADALALLSLPTAKAKATLDDFIRLLLQNSSPYPCELISNIFVEIVPHDKRFQIALDVVLPSFMSGTNTTSRIASAYILYSLYTPHPIDINPFKSVLLEQLQLLRRQSADHKTPALTDNIQLIWVIWKILSDRGADLDSLSPGTIASHSLSEGDLNECLNNKPHTGPSFEPEIPMIPEASTSTDPGINAPMRATPSPGVGNRDSLSDGSDAPDSDNYEEKLSRAVTLLMTARLRVLTLSEIKSLKPYLPTLASPLPVLKAPDIPELITYNSTLARPLLVLLLHEHPSDWVSYLDMLAALPPTPACFDVFGQMLQDDTLLRSDVDGSNVTVADLVRTEALGGFIHSCVEWVDIRERDSREEGHEQIDDSLEKAAVNLCRFYASLIQLSVVDPSSDIEVAEMAHFTLQHSQLEEANALYRLIAAGRG